MPWMCPLGDEEKVVATPCRSEYLFCSYLIKWKSTLKYVLLRCVRVNKTVMMNMLLCNKNEDMGFSSLLLNNGIKCSFVMAGDVVCVFMCERGFE